MFVVPMMLTDERRWRSTNMKMITMIVVEVDTTSGDDEGEGG